MLDQVFRARGELECPRIDALILGASYPGAALVVGPVLITVPYAVARALANRATTVLDRRRAG